MTTRRIWMTDGKKKSFGYLICPDCGVKIVCPHCGRYVKAPIGD